MGKILSAAATLLLLFGLWIGSDYSVSLAIDSSSVGEPSNGLGDAPLDVESAPENEGDLAVGMESAPEDEEDLAVDTESAPEGTQDPQLHAGISRHLEGVFDEEECKDLIRAFTLEESEIYSFLQGPRSWEKGIPWSGEWCYFGANGYYFGNFGCGLCCLANIYDTLSPYEVSPWDMFEYARKHTDYSPSNSRGAIGWGEMQDVLGLCGISSELFVKPSSYEQFQEQMRDAKTAIVLVSSYEDDTFWENTSGHYVNLWLYEEETDTVFLAEPGSYWNARKRIPLRYAYDALKTASKYQYLLVDGYEETENQWKQDGIDEVWNRP